MKSRNWISTELALPREGVMVAVRTSEGEEAVGYAAWFDFVVHEGRIIRVTPYPDGWSIRMRGLEVPKGAVVEWRPMNAEEPGMGPMLRTKKGNLRGLGGAIMSALRASGKPMLTKDIAIAVQPQYDMDIMDLYRRVIQKVHAMGKSGELRSEASGGRGNGKLWSIAVHEF